MIRIDAVWLAVALLDMRCGMAAVLARIVAVFGEARPHTAYLFTNARATRLRILVHDGYGLRLCARRLHQGRFDWLTARSDAAMPISKEQLQALLIGLPWQRMDAVIRAA